MKTALSILLLVHGLIHVLGFAKAFRPADVGQLSQPLSRLAGVFWLLAMLLFLFSALLLLTDNRSWWIAALAAVVLSQVLIVLSWNDAKFGTVVNAIVLLPLVASLMTALPSSYPNRYRAEVERRLRAERISGVLQEAEIQHLPGIVQKYLRYTGALGKPKVQNFRVEWQGMMKRSLTSDWMAIRARQYNFLDDPARIFFIESKLYGIPFDGLHLYIGDSATMQIKVASLLEVVDARGDLMTRGETVTLFNDICVLAPAALVDQPIKWESIDSLTVKATYTNGKNTITAVLSFDPDGSLISFRSDDRYLSADGKDYQRHPWSTPVKGYKELGGRKVPTFAEALWHLPEGDFPYARYTLAEIEYNCQEFR